MTEIVFARKSEEYERYVEDFICKFNGNGKKTLLFVCDSAYPLVDGVWNVLSSCVAELRDNYSDFNVVVMCPDYKGKVYVQNVPVLAVKSIYLKSLHYQLALPQFDFRLKKWLKKLKIDMIHCHSPFLCGLLARKLHRKRNVPMVATFHSQFKQDFLKVTKSRALTKFGLNIIMKVFRDSDETWTMHTASRDTLYSYGYSGTCRLMPNATRLQPLSNYDEVRNDFRVAHNVQNKVVFLFVGRIIKQKGIFFIVDVLNILKQRGLAFKMFFVGDGPDLKKLQDEVRSCRLDEVEFVGNVECDAQLAAYYAGADLLLFPSRYDVSSIVQIEAATYKTPTVFSEGSVTSCTVSNNVNGYILPFDVQKYSQGVLDILNSDTLPQVGENALRDLHVDWSSIVSESVAVYNRLMEKGGSKNSSENKN